MKQRAAARAASPCRGCRRRRAGSDRAGSPGSIVASLRQLPISRPAPTISTSDSATCATTRAFPIPNRLWPSATPRPCAFIAVCGSTRPARHAGTSPNSSPVSVATRDREEPALADRHRDRATRRDRDRERSLTRSRLPHVANDDPERRTERREEQALGDELPRQPSAPGAEREPHRHLALAHGRAREQQVGDVRAGDQQHHARRSP